MLIEEGKVGTDQTWDLSGMYESEADWKRQIKTLVQREDPPFWPELFRMKGRLIESVDNLKETLDLQFQLEKELLKFYTFAHCKFNEDITNERTHANLQEIVNLVQAYKHEISWIETEIIHLPEDVFEVYLQNNKVRPYEFYLKHLDRLRNHILSHSEERLVTLAHQALITPYKAFTALIDGDLTFQSIEDTQQQNHDLTLSNYKQHLYSSDRVLRKNAYETLHQQFFHHKNTMAELFNGTIQAHVFESRARNYDSALEMVLDYHQIPIQVYSNLIDTVKKNTHYLHRYLELRKKILNLDELRMYDLHTPLVTTTGERIPYPKAFELLMESVLPLGQAYQETLRKGLTKERWIHLKEHKHKRSGAFSGGSYGTNPFISMHYQGLMSDVLTLAHEAGHSMHTYLTQSNQPFHYSENPIFTAEVASTFTEELVFRHLLKVVDNKDAKMDLLNQRIDELLAVFFRQVAFAEFEWLSHEMVEKNVPLSPERLSELYRAVVEQYYGDAVAYDPCIDIEWSRIPHFHYRFYVYQYATGKAASLSLVDRVLKGGELDKERYLNFLKSGFTDYPINLLKDAGVDMCTPGPIEDTLGMFGSLVDEFEKLAI